MARVRYEELDGRARARATLLKPSPAPAGYTGNTAVTEWLILNCRGDFGSVSDGHAVRVRFADPEDCARALARFGGKPLGPG